MYKDKKILGSAVLLGRHALVTPIVFEDFFDVYPGGFERGYTLVFLYLAESGIVCRQSQLHIALELLQKLFEIQDATGDIIDRKSTR